MQCVNINLEVVTDQMHQFRYRVSGLRIGLILATLFSAPAAWAELPDMRVRKKLIATGWDHPDSQRLLANRVGRLLILLGVAGQGRRRCSMVR